MVQRMNCFVCNERFISHVMRLMVNLDPVAIQTAIRYRSELGLQPMDINNTSRLCINCTELVRTDVENAGRPECIRLKVLKSKSTEVCCICYARPDTMRRLTVKARVKIYVDTSIYFPQSVRVCPQHLEGEKLITVFYEGLKSLNRPFQMDGHEVSNFFQELRALATVSRGDKWLDFDSTSEDDFKNLTSITKQEFDVLFSFCDPIIDNDQRRYITKKDLLTFLCKLRQGLSDEYLKILFSYSSRQNVSMVISIVRRSLMTRFVPQNIGFQSITREEFINRHVTDFADALYNPDPNVRKAIAISDGTYSYIEKSGNYRALRQSFSVHKGRHLVKPVLINGPDGYILEIQGPYFADGRNNDAEILRNEMERDKNNIREWFEPGDIFLVDRGYRDVLPYLEDLGFTCKMPACLVGNQKQLTTQQANESRIVTIQRWVVEARNGHIKTGWKFFDGIIPRAHVLHLRDFYLIAGAFLNRFHGPLIMEGKTPELARDFLNKVVDVNVIQARVELEHLARRNTMWIRLDANQVQDFPIFDFDYLKRVTTGTYQLGLAPSYVQDKLDHDGTEIFELDAHRTEPGFIRIRVYSRYRNATRYQLWIAFENRDDEERDEEPMEINEDGPILAYYCTCKSGARTLGCCAHIASVLWYLGYARHQRVIKYPSQALLDYIEDAADRWHPPEEQLNVIAE